MNTDTLIACRNAIQIAFPNGRAELEPTHHETPEHVSFRVNRTANGSISIHECRIRVYLRAFYGDSANKYVNAPHEVPGAIKCLEDLLFGPEDRSLPIETPEEQRARETRVIDDFRNAMRPMNEASKRRHSGDNSTSAD